LVPGAEAQEPKGTHPDMGSVQATGSDLATDGEGASSLSRSATVRQQPKVGAVGDNSSCTDLCGGCRVTGIPTAINEVVEFRVKHPVCGGISELRVAILPRKWPC
jgi:hypothetical protein